MPKINFKSILSTLLLFNLILNSVILSSKYEYFNQIPISFMLLVVIGILVIYFFFNYLISSYKIDIFSFIFLLTSIISFKNINPSYFWESVPDSRTYKLLGNGLTECLRLTYSCSSESHLEFAIGQPLFSGILSKYLYEYSYIVNILMIAFVIYSISKITEVTYSKTTGLGVFYLLSQSLIYELTPLMISEVTFTFFLFLYIFIFLTKYKNQIITLPLIYGFLILVRPVGIALFPIFVLISKRRKLTIIIFFLILFLAATFNFLTSGEFIISDFNLDSRQDGLFENSGYLNYFFELIMSDNDTKSNFTKFTLENYQRLYGESSKDCTFNETCIFYNPKYNQDGTRSSFFNDSTIGTLIKKYTIFFYNIRAPQQIGLVMLPLILIVPFFSRSFKIEKLLSISVILLITPSLLTAEYGSRWNFTILFISGLIIEMISSRTIKNMRKK